MTHLRSAAVEPDALASGVAWKQVSTGVTLIGLGGFLLATTRGALPWSFWAEALTFWPVLLVVAGLGVVVDRTRYAWASLISPVLVLGTLGWLAARGAPEPVETWGPVQAERSETASAWTLESRSAFAVLAIEGRALRQGLLAEGRSSPIERARLSVAERDGRARVTAEQARAGSGSIVLPPRHHQRWELAVSEELPLALDLELAFVEGELRVARAPIERVAIGGAMNRLRLELGVPADTVRVSLDGAFNELELVVPAATPVSVATDGPLNSVRGRENAASLEGPGYDLRIDGLRNRVVVSSP